MDPATVANSNNFPPLAWLGYGIDLTSANITNIHSVTANIRKLKRVIALSETCKQQTFGPINWVVPAGVDVSGDETVSEGGFQTWESGTSLIHDFETSTDLSAKYLAFSGDIKGSFLASSNFVKSRQYALFDYSQTILGAAFSDYTSNIDHAHLESLMRDIGAFNSGDSSSVNKYNHLFHNLGSHIVVGANYGGRLTLTTWADNSTQEQKSSFATNVTAKFNGLVTGGDFDASVKTTSAYKEFYNKSGQSCYCTGGDVSVAGKIQMSPQREDVYELYKEWQASASATPNLISVQTVAVWDLMAAIGVAELVSWAVDVEQAFTYLCSNPATHLTKARFTVNSDWGEFCLTSPTASVEIDPGSPAPEGTLIKGSKVHWGTEGSHQVSRGVGIDFFIKNDGSPVDITLSHGNDSEKKGDRKGNCSVTFKIPEPYVNNLVKKTEGNIFSKTYGEGSNTMQWFGCDVNH